MEKWVGWLSYHIAEYTGYLLVFFTFFILAEVLRKDRHINITAITSRLPRTVEKGLALFRALLTLALMVVIIFITSKSALFSI